MFEGGLEELLVVVGEELVDFFFLVFEVAASFVEEDEDGEGEAEDGDDVAEEFPGSGGP